MRSYGYALDQGDLDVWEAILYSTSTTPLGVVSKVSRRGLLRRLGRDPAKGDRLHAQVEKLAGANVRIRAQLGDRAIGYLGSLCIVDWAESLAHGAAKYAISIPPTMAELFGASQYTLVNWAVRKELARAPLAQWLHAFFSSHNSPLPYSLRKLHELSGSENADLKSFRQKLKKALGAIAKASEKHGEAFAGTVDEHDRVLAVYTRKHGAQQSAPG